MIVDAWEDFTPSVPTCGVVMFANGLQQSSDDETTSLHPQPSTAGAVAAVMSRSIPHDCLRAVAGRGVNTAVQALRSPAAHFPHD